MNKLTDRVDTINNTLIQHGKENDRIYIMKINDTKENAKKLIADIDSLAKTNKYTKIFAKVPEYLKDIFEKNGYLIEAKIPKFFNGKDNCFFMAKYLNRDRSKNKAEKLTKEVLETSLNKTNSKSLSLDKRYCIKKCSEENIEDICKLYGEVFETYPFPIFDPNYIKNTMKDNVIYFGAFVKDKLVAISSIELYREDETAEMTDFSTHPDYRGENLSLHLLNEMEKELKTLEIPTAYTIARSVSFGMNSTFSKLNYSYAGTLINNTNIGGQIESMNVWFKSIEN